MSLASCTQQAMSTAPPYASAQTWKLLTELLALLAPLWHSLSKKQKATSENKLGFPYIQKLPDMPGNWTPKMAP
ncbi:Hypothetical predicted protein [Podarcis lilfordi]|uniref:Uncharacterized protein n=1 Tax=Podarcis lilfordi TaxID=74358 RepID=A0AA35P5F0_9SAUR|nr:Hypothetical predicted protein [Podarcis lilfordi]